MKRLVDYILGGGIKGKVFVARKKPENLLYRVENLSKDKLYVTEYNEGQFKQTKYNLIKHLMDIEGDFNQKVFIKENMDEHSFVSKYES